ncbi:MAG: rhodanese-like domain-containing protein [Pyrinomonadaceae bacterium]
MKILSLSVLLLSILVGALLCAACNTSATSSNTNSPPAVNGSPLTPAADGVPRISVADAKLAVDKGEAVIVDARPADAYRQEHIKGSINIPSNEAAARIAELPKGKLLIAYCS